MIRCRIQLALAAALVASTAQAQLVAADGARLYKENCAACHQAEGQGVPGAFPALAGDAFVSGPSEALTAVVLNGRGGMPSFREELSAAKIAAILTYVRSAWGAKAPPIDAAAVEAGVAAGSAIMHPKSNLPYGGRLPD